MMLIIPPLNIADGLDRKLANVPWLPPKSEDLPAFLLLLPPLILPLLSLLHQSIPVHLHELI